MLPGVYTAARAAAASELTARNVAARVVSAGARAGERDVQMLAARAAVAAVRADPAPAFAAMPESARDAVVLARLGGLKTPEIALALDIPEAEVRRRLTAGLRAAAVGSAPEPFACCA